MSTFAQCVQHSGVSRMELARAIDADLFTIACYESGEPIPDSHAVRFGSMFGVSPDYVQHGDELMRETLRELFEDED
jgi:hypothetical protein